VVTAFTSGESQEARGDGARYSIRPLSANDARVSARLHREVLGAEFLTRAGVGFLRLYHLAWCESPAGLALAAVDAGGDVIGVLLGALQPAAHYRFMARRHGIGMAARLLGRAATHPLFARELLATRAARYARGAVRLASRRPGAPRGPERGMKEAEITHLMVAPAARMAGVARGLVQEALRVAQAAGLDQVVLVTPPELAASGFYVHLGWQPYGEVTSRSGEHFVRYRWPLVRRAVAPGRDGGPASCPAS
jgi:ribosomal protein S18 acetylase RimI-like enzyme